MSVKKLNFSECYWKEPFIKFYAGDKNILNVEYIEYIKKIIPNIINVLMLLQYHAREPDILAELHPGIKAGFTFVACRII